MLKRQTYKSVCDAMVDAGIIESWVRKQVDASFDEDRSTLFSAIAIAPALENPLVTRITNETYGKNSELYLHTKYPQALASALRAAGVNVDSVQANRLIVHVSYFKGYHWWE